VKGLHRRIDALEARVPGHNGSLDHLSDEELEGYVLDLIQRFAEAGVKLPQDWREQYDRSAIRFLEWLDREVKEMIACEA
jgi:hypothetical protein